MNKDDSTHARHIISLLKRTLLKTSSVKKRFKCGWNPFTTTFSNVFQTFYSHKSIGRVSFECVGDVYSFQIVQPLVKCSTLTRTSNIHMHKNTHSNRIWYTITIYCCINRWLLWFYDFSTTIDDVYIVSFETNVMLLALNISNNVTKNGNWNNFIRCRIRSIAFSFRQSTYQLKYWIREWILEIYGFRKYLKIVFWNI